MTEQDRWRLEAGEEIVPGRLALALLGGGERFETDLAWDSALFTTVVAKVLFQASPTTNGRVRTSGARRRTSMR